MPGSQSARILHDDGFDLDLSGGELSAAWRSRERVD